jgi:hypothetical protein
MPFTECLYGVPCVTLRLKNCPILALFFFFVFWAVLLAPSPSKYPHFNCSNILVNMYLQLWLLSYAYQQRGREGEHSRGGGLPSWGHAWHNTDLLLEVCSCNIHSRFGCCPPIPDVLYARASWQCNRAVSCVSFFFVFGMSSFQFCLLVSNFGCFMYISCKSCQCFHLYLLPNTDIHWFGISEHLIVEKMERQMSGNDYKFRITVYGCGLLPLIYIETLLQ